MPGTFGTYVQLDPVKLAELLRGPNGPVMRRMIEDGELVKIEAKRLVGVSKPDPVPRRNPRRPGTMRDSIVKRFAEQSGQAVVMVGTDDPAALYHHEGTVAHPITPKSDSGLLVFYWSRTGRVMFVRRVSHPGTRPNRFLVDALRVLRSRY